MKAGWQKKKLGEICEFEGGSQPPKSQFIYEPRIGYVRFLQIRDFSNDKNITFIPESKKNRLCREDDIMIGRYGASVGKILTGKAGAYNVALMKTIPNLELMRREWFHRYLLSDEFQLRLMNVAARSAQDGFSKEDIFNFPIFIPPLPEQHRIVALLDDAFDGIATAKAKAEKNLQNARALFESHLKSVFMNRGEGWNTKTLSECFRLKSGDGLTSKAMKSGQYPVYGGNGIAGMHDEFNLSGDNVIIGRVGALCGNARRITEKIWLTDNAFKIVDFSYEFDSAFLAYLLNFKNLRGFARQTAQPVISNSSLKDLVLDFPKLPEQQRIAIQLDALVVEIEHLESLYQQKLTALDDLKKSLMHQAFSGAL